MSSNVETFSVTVIGDVTGEKHTGIFKTKIRLSHRDQLKMDEIRRDLLGKNPESASPRAQNQADVFSTIAVHIVEAPNWWVAKNNGLDLEDDNIVGVLYEEIAKIKLAASKKLQSDAEAAKAELAKKE